MLQTGDELPILPRSKDAPDSSEQRVSMYITLLGSGIGTPSTSKTQMNLIQRIAQETIGDIQFTHHTLRLLLCLLLGSMMHNRMLAENIPDKSN